MRRSLIAFAAAAACTAALPAAALADACDDNVVNCEGAPIPFKVKNVTALAPVKSLALYDQILPAPYTMPAEPQVALYLSHLEIPTEIPGLGYNEYARWIEGGIAIKGTYKGEQGWYPLAVPLNSQFEYDFGRGAGFPKVLGETDIEDGAGGTRRIFAKVKGGEVMDLRFAPGQGTPDKTLRDYVQQRDPVLTLNPALDVKAGTPTRTKFTAKAFAPLADFGAPAVAGATALAEPRPGTVRYAVEPDFSRYDDDSPDALPNIFGNRDLSDLMETEGELSGAAWDSSHIIVLSSGEAPARKAPVKKAKKAKRRKGGRR